MKRREFISLVGAMTAAWPLVTRAHQAGMKRSGVLISAAQTDLEETFSDGYPEGIIISRKTTGACRLTPEEFRTACAMVLPAILSLVVISLMLLGFWAVAN
jgi:hypothetical protein